MPMRPPVHRPAYLPTPQQRQRAYDRDRGSTTVRGYGADWRRVRAQQLGNEPLCRLCAERGLVTAATEVDHIETIRDRPDLRLEPSNLRSVCRDCHQGRTSSDGGRARPRG